MRVGIIGTGAIAQKHAQAYKNIGYEITVCTNTSPVKGQAFADATGAEFVSSYEEVCRHPRVDYVDVCTFPDFRLLPVELCAKLKKHILVQKPIATNLETARTMIQVARNAGIQLGVVSQHRFDDSASFLKKAIADGRLGKIIQADAYVKWYRSAEYYSRPIKGSWAVEGGGALINQAIHQVDVLLFFTWSRQSGIGRLAIGRRAQYRIGRHRECAPIVFLRRNGGDTSLHRTLARISGANRNPRDQRHRNHHRR